MRKAIMGLVAAAMIAGAMFGTETKAEAAGGFCTWYYCVDGGQVQYFYYDSNYPTWTYDWSSRAWRQANRGNNIIANNGANIIANNGANIRLTQYR